MRQVLTHTVRSMDEIAGIVAKHGGFTAPLGLPHYRYDRTRSNLRALVKCGLLARHGSHDIHHYFKAGERMAAWVLDGKPPVREWINRQKGKPTIPQKPTKRLSWDEILTISHGEKNAN